LAFLIVFSQQKYGWILKIAQGWRTVIHLEIEE